MAACPGRGRPGRQQLRMANPRGDRASAAVSARRRVATGTAAVRPARGSAQSSRDHTDTAWPTRRGTCDARPGPTNVNRRSSAGRASLARAHRPFACSTACAFAAFRGHGTRRAQGSRTRRPARLADRGRAPVDTASGNVRAGFRPGCGAAGHDHHGPRPIGRSADPGRHQDDTSRRVGAHGRGDSPRRWATRSDAASDWRARRRGSPVPDRPARPLRHACHADGA